MDLLLESSHFATGHFGQDLKWLQLDSLFPLSCTSHAHFVPTNCRNEVILLPQATFAFSHLSQAPIYSPPTPHHREDTHQALTECGSEERGLWRHSIRQAPINGSLFTDPPSFLLLSNKLWSSSKWEGSRMAHIPFVQYWTVRAYSGN